MRLKYKIGIFISFLAVFLMSQNSFALDLPSNAYLASYYRGNNIHFKPDNTGSWITNNSYYGFGINTGHGQGFKTVAINNSNHTMSVVNGDYLVITGQAKFYSMYMGELQTQGFIGIGAQNTNCAILSFTTDDVISDNPDDTWTNTYNVLFTVIAYCSTSSDNPVVNLELHAWNTSGVTEVDIYFSTLSKWKLTDNLSDVNGTLNSILGWLQSNADDAGDVLQQEKQDVQDASDNSETTAENNSENQQTDNIIGVFGSFVSALSSLQPTNCNVTLQWPASLGGNMTVNVCQNKDKAGSIISVFGSITLLVFYLPLALKLLSMIYNEIRSFTNG